MSTWLVAVMGLVYAVVAVDQIMKGAPWIGVMFLGYAIGNLGLTMQVKQESLCWQSIVVRSLKYRI